METQTEMFFYLTLSNTNTRFGAVIHFGSSDGPLTHIVAGHRVLFLYLCRMKVSSSHKRLAGWRLQTGFSFGCDEARETRWLEKLSFKVNEKKRERNTGRGFFGNKEEQN